jgi:hypothetical protein
MYTDKIPDVSIDNDWFFGDLALSNSGYYTTSHNF